MSHPLKVNHLEEDNSLKLSEHIAAHFLFTLVIVCKRSVGKELDNIVLGYLAKLFGSVFEIIGSGEQACKMSLQTGKVPLIVNGAVDDVKIYAVNDPILNHLKDILVDILAVEDLCSLLIDDSSLCGHNVVVVEDVLSDSKVSALHLLL